MVHRSGRHRQHLLYGQVVTVDRGVQTGKESRQSLDGGFCRLLPAVRHPPRATARNQASSPRSSLLHRGRITPGNPPDRALHLFVVTLQDLVQSTAIQFVQVFDSAQYTTKMLYIVTTARWGPSPQDFRNSQPMCSWARRLPRAKSRRTGSASSPSQSAQKGSAGSPSQSVSLPWPTSRSWR